MFTLFGGGILILTQSMSGGRVLLFPKRAVYVWRRRPDFSSTGRSMFGGGVLILPIQGEVFFGGGVLIVPLKGEVCLAKSP